MKIPATPEELLSDLVAIESPSGGEERAARHVHDLARAMGLAAEYVGTSVLIRPREPCGAGGAGGTRPRLLYASHLDTVPVGAGWDGDPFDGAWKGDRLVARGANDAKASVTAMLWAAAELARGPGLDGELILSFNACEETTNEGMTRVLGLIGLPDAAVVGEPTGLEVVRAQAGLVVMVAEWSGRACHAAHVGRAPHANALLAAARELAGLPGFLEVGALHPLLGVSTMAPTMLVAGERHNVVPDRAECTFDCRIAPPLDEAACRDALERALPTASVRVRSARLRAVETSADHPLVLEALACAGRVQAIGSNALSDMALLSAVPAVKCGPGETVRSHTPNEWITRDELQRGVRFYRELAPNALRELSRAPITLTR